MMTSTEYTKWRRNGNFTISQQRMLEVSNHISEGETSCYTKAEAAQCAQYWGLCHSAICDQLHIDHLDRLNDAIQHLLASKHTVEWDNATRCIYQGEDALFHLDGVPHFINYGRTGAAWPATKALWVFSPDGTELRVHARTSNLFFP